MISQENHMWLIWAQTMSKHLISIYEHRDPGSPQCLQPIIQPSSSADWNACMVGGFASSPVITLTYIWQVFGALFTFASSASNVAGSPEWKRHGSWCCCFWRNTWLHLTQWEIGECSEIPLHEHWWNQSSPGKGVSERTSTHSRLQTWRHVYCRTPGAVPRLLWCMQTNSMP